jgi:nicotinamide-nucleotide amidase
VIVEVLAIGTELLLGQIVNTNATTIGARLADAGLDHFHQSVVGDNVERIAAAIRLAGSRSDALIITGGIGPTQDDLTREAICRAADVEMEFSAGYAEELRIRWEARGRQMPESNLRQAQYPAGAEMIRNPKGSAPALRMDIGGTWVFAVPGVPAEMIPLVDEHVIPFLKAEAGGDTGVVVSRVIRTWGRSESRVGELLADLFDDSANPTLAFLASSGEIKVRLTAKAETVAAADELIAPVSAEVVARLSPSVFGVDEETIEVVLHRALSKRGWTIGTAESATGGMVATRLTSVPGASSVFRGSVVAYDEDVKHRLLGVARETLEAHGAVSPEVALEMAEGAARHLGVDVAVATTGSAGPEPHGRPVGTMVVAVRTPQGSRARTLSMPGDRERIRTFTTTAALHLTRLGIANTWWRDDVSSMWGVRPGGTDK